MQAVAVAKIMSQAPAGAGAAGSGASDAVAADGVDFAAILAAQFQGGGGGALPAVAPEAGAETPAASAGVEHDASNAVVADGVDFVAAQFQGKDGAALTAIGAEAGVEAPLKADGAIQDLKAEVAQDLHDGAVADPMLQAMALMPGVVSVMQTMQQATPEIKPSLSTPLSDKSPGERKISAFPGLADDGKVPTNDKDSLLAKEGAAEFAVGGKSLPSGDSKDVDTKVANAFKLPNLPVDAPRTPDALSAVSAIMSVSQSRAASEIKVPVGSVQPPVGASGWGDALGQKLVWMAGQHQQVAELHLNPPNLGPMEVRLTISNDQVSALFVSHQPAVREAIEAAMPRLREMFADSGMMLGNATVSSDSLPQQQNSGQERQSGAESRSDFPPVDGYSTPVTSRGIMHLPGDGRGMVDLFA